MKAGVIVFPGSNCERDVMTVLQTTYSRNIKYIWYQDSFIDGNYDFIVVPGGFSYGDYLRPGAIASRSNIINELRKYDQRNGVIIGICNGFQILTEAGLLPGALIRNQNLKFICKDVLLRVSNSRTVFTNKYKKQEVIKLPVAHSTGNYVADDDTLQSLRRNQQIVFQYGDEHSLDDINGSCLSIAGIINKKGNILGMMPHPERAVDSSISGNDGSILFDSLRIIL